MDSGSTAKSQTSGLIPWKPGQSGNPNGRPKGIKALRAQLDGEKIREALEALAFDEDSRHRFEALKLLAAYKWGPPAPLDEDMTVFDVLKSMSVERAKTLMEGGNHGNPEGI